MPSFLRRGLEAWRGGLEGMTDADLDTVGRSAYPGGLDRRLPLLDIVWWVNKELLEHVPVEIFETLANWSSTNAKRVSSRAETLHSIPAPSAVCLNWSAA